MIIGDVAFGSAMTMMVRNIGLKEEILVEYSCARLLYDIHNE